MNGQQAGLQEGHRRHSPVGRGWHLLNALLGVGIMIVSVGTVFAFEIATVPSRNSPLSTVIALVGIACFVGSYYVVSIRAAHKARNVS